jgi:HK97 family phage major capsid protein
MTHSNEVGHLAYELRKALEQKDVNDVLVQGKISNIEASLDKLEAKNAELVAKLAAEEKASLELKEQAESLEKKLLRMPSGAARSAVKSDEVKAFEDLLRFGANSPKLQQKYLRTDIDPSGGYLAPEEYVEEILRKITEISPVRQVARVRSTTRDSIAIPRRDTLVAGYWIGEGAPLINNNSSYGLELIKVNKASVNTIATMEMLTDAAFNMEAEITQDIVERFAQLEGEAFVVGNAIEKPEGFMNNPDVQVVNSGVANSFGADALIDLTGELKTGYNPMFMINRRTLAFIRRLKDGNGQYLWAAGISDGQPNTILGYPYASAIDMPDVGTGTEPVAFGDFMRGYNIVDGITMSMIRDEYSLSREGKVSFVAHRRVGGQVVMAEAIKKLRCAL